MRKNKIVLEKAPECMGEVFGSAAAGGGEYDPDSLMTDMENWVRDRGVLVAVSPDDEEGAYVLGLGEREVRMLSADACLSFLTGMGMLIEYLEKTGKEAPV